MAGLPLMQEEADPAFACAFERVRALRHSFRSPPTTLGPSTGHSAIAGAALLKALLAERLSQIPPLHTSPDACSKGSPLKSRRMALTGCASLSENTSVAGG